MNKLKKQQICGFLTRHRFRDRLSIETWYNDDGVQTKVMCTYKCEICGKKIYENGTKYSLWGDKYEAED